MIRIAWLLWFVPGVLAGPLYNGMLRIVPSGSDPYRGRLEIIWWYRWGTVCNDYFTHTNADVACRQMGLDGGWRVGRYNQNGLCRNVDGRYMCGHGYIWLDNVHCSGRERRLRDCHHLPFGWHDCGHHEDVIIQCRPPPLWNIEWDYVDQPDVKGYISGVVASYVLFLKRTATPNMFTKCWPEWKANEKVRIMIYTDDTDEKEKPAHLGKTHMNWSWLVGWIQPPWYLPYVYVSIRGQHCDMERIRGIACEENYEIPPDFVRSYCWETNPRMPAEYTLLQEYSQTLPVSNYTQPETSPNTLTHEIAESMMAQLSDEHFRMEIGLDTTVIV